MMKTTTDFDTTSLRVRRYRPSIWHRILPEGPIIALLLLGVNLCAGFAVSRGGWEPLIVNLPMLAFFGSEKEPMGWDATAQDLMPFFPRGTEVEQIEGVGHFIHIEQPGQTAARILRFLQP